MDRRIAHAILRRVLPEGFFVPAASEISIESATLRVNKLVIQNENAFGTLFGVSIELHRLSVSCESAEIHLFVIGDAGTTKSDASEPGLASRQSDSATAAAVNQLMNWIVRLSTNSQLTVGCLVVVASVPGLAVFIAISASGIKVSPSEQVIDGFVVAINARIANVEFHLLPPSEAAYRKGTVAERTPMQHPFSCPAILIVSDIQATYCVPSPGALGPLPSLRVNVRSLFSRLNACGSGPLSALLSLAVPGSETNSETSIASTAPIETPALAVSHDGRTDAETPTTVDYAVSAAGLTNLSTLEDHALVGSTHGGLFTAVRALWTAVWNGSDSVRIKLPHALEAPKPLGANGVFSRMGLTAEDVDDTGFEDIADVPKDSSMHSSQYASFSAPSTKVNESRDDDVSDMGIPSTSSSLALQCNVERVDLEMLFSLDNGCQRLCDCPVIAAVLDGAKLTWNTADVSESDALPGDAPLITCHWDNADVRVQTRRTFAAAAESISQADSTVRLQIQDCLLNARREAVGWMCRARVSRVIVDAASIPMCTQWLCLARPAVDRLQELLASTEHPDKSVTGTDELSDVPMRIQSFRIDSVECSCGFEGFSRLSETAILRLDLQSAEVSYEATLPHAAFSVMFGSVQDTSALFCKAMRSSISISGVTSGVLRGSPIPMIILTPGAPTWSTLSPQGSPSDVTLLVGSARIYVSWDSITLVNTILSTLQHDLNAMQLCIQRQTGLQSNTSSTKGSRFDMLLQNALLVCVFPVTGSNDFVAAEAQFDTVRGSLESAEDLNVSCNRIYIGFRRQDDAPFLRALTCEKPSSIRVSRHTSIVSALQQQVNLTLGDVCVSRCLSVAEFALGCLDALTRLTQHDISVSAAPNLSTTPLLVVRLTCTSILVAESDLEISPVIFSRGISVSAFLIGGPALDAGVQASVELLALHLARHTCGNIDFTHISESPAIVLLSDSFGIFCSANRNSGALLEVDVVDVNCFNDTLDDCYSVLESFLSVNDRIATLIKCFNRNSPEPISLAIPTSPLPAESPAFCASAPLYKVARNQLEQTYQQHQKRQTTEQFHEDADWDATHTNPATSPANDIAASLSGEFESACLVDAPHRCERIGTDLSHHPAFSSFIKVQEDVQNCDKDLPYSRTALDLITNFNVVGLEPNDSLRTPEEWLAGCSPELSAPTRAVGLYIASLRQCTLSLHAKASHLKLVPCEPFLGIRMCLTTCRAMHTQHNQLTSGADVFGWKLIQRSACIVDLLSIDDALPAPRPDAIRSPHQPQDGQVNVALALKAPSGAQQPSLTCTVQWVLPNSAGLIGHACAVPRAIRNADIEIRVWIDAAPLEVHLRGRVLLFLQSLLRTIDHAAGPVPTAEEAASNALNTPQSMPVFFQLLCISDQRLTLSFSPDPGMTEIVLGGEGSSCASIPLLQVDRLELCLRGVRVHGAVGLPRAVQATVTGFISQAQEQDSLSRLFSNIPTSIIPFAHAVVDWLSSSLKLAGSVIHDVVPQRSATGSDWISTVNHVIGTAYHAGVVGTTGVFRRGLAALAPAPPLAHANVTDSKHDVMADWHEI